VAKLSPMGEGRVGFASGVGWQHGLRPWENNMGVNKPQGK
jgi:hypothetical protein